MFDEWSDGLAACSAWRGNAQVPRDDEDTGDHDSDQDPGTGSEKDICDIHTQDVHSDFPLFNLMGYKKPGEPFRQALISGFSPRPVSVLTEV